MEITLLHVADCPNLALARDRVSEAAQRVGRDVRVTERLVCDPAEAEELGFIGSPTILVDGVDPFISASTTPALACRRYATSDGMQGAPTVGELVEALR
jgi:hypothetical protein